MTKQSEEARAALATAIAAHRDSENMAAGLRSSIDRVSDELYQAKSELDAAREADEGTEAERARSIIAGGDVTVLERPAHSNVEEVEKTIAACRRALTILRSELSEVETTGGYREGRVRDAVGGVLIAEVLEGATHDVEQLKCELERAQVVLAFIRERYAPSTEMRLRVDRALWPPVAPDSGAPILERWRRAVGGLMRDASAPLP